MENERLAALVRRRRLELRLTQAQAAERAGVSIATWQTLERSAYQGGFTDLTLSRVSQALDLDMETLFDAAGQTFPGERAAVSDSPGPDPEALLDQVEQSLRHLLDASEEEFLLVVSHILELCELLQRRSTT